jgi:hypothetical protein
MRNSDKTPQPRKPKDIAQDIADRTPLDRDKLRRSGRHAAQAADRLLKEMDDVLRHLERKR